MNPTSVRVAVVGSRGRLGAFASALVQRSPDFELVGAFDRSTDWRGALRDTGAQVVFEATRAGLGFEHGVALLERGLRPVIATSGVSAEQSDELDRRAREAGLGGLVVPNFSLGALLMQQFAAQAARWFDAAEVIEMHHQSKPDAPSGTALETARLMAAARREAGRAASGAVRAEPPARGELHEGVALHSVRLPGAYAHQEVLLGAPGELLTLRHDMSGPEAFAPGILLALRHAATALGVARGLHGLLDLRGR